MSGIFSLAARSAPRYDVDWVGARADVAGRTARAVTSMLSCSEESDGGYLVRDRWAMRSARVGLAAVVAMAVAGCSHNLEVDATLDKPPAVEPLPVAMGVHYSPELRTYHRGNDRGFHTFDADLGPPSIALFDQVYSSMFARVIPVAEHPTALDETLDVAAIIVMRIERFQPFEYMAQDIPVTIEYRTWLYSPQGRQIATWTVDGSGAFAEEFDVSRLKVWSVESIMEELTKVAMRRAAARFITGFRQQPDVARWLADINLASTPPTL